MDKRGFTLIELLITVAIIGILAAVAVTAYIGTTKKAARSEAFTNLESLRLLEEQFLAENTTYSNTAANIAAIQADLPGFQPGSSTSFTYAITQDFALVPPVAVPYAGGAVASPTPCFIAVATGIANSRVAGDVFVIDCNNITNF